MPVERDCCFLCMLSVGLPPVSMREIQPGVLGNYRDKPPSEHMCFGLTNLHKDSTWPVCFSAFHPYLNNTLTPSPKKGTRTHISQNLCFLCAFPRKEIRFRRRLLPSFSVFLCVFLRSASLRNILLFSPTGFVVASLLSCRAQKLPLRFSTGVCESHCRRAGSCKLLISLRAREIARSDRICIYLQLYAPAK